MAAGATLDFVGGYSLGAGSSFSGSGLIENKGPPPVRILGNITLNGVTLANKSLIQIDTVSSASIFLMGGATLDNMPGAKVETNGPPPIRIAVTDNGTFVNDGLLDVQGGTFSVETGTSSGTFQVAGGAALQFLGAYGLAAGTSFSGGGLVQVKGPPPIRILGNITLNGVTLANEGLIQIDTVSTASIFLMGGATLDNMPGAKVETNGPPPIRIAVTDNGTFVNDGLLDVQGGTFSVETGTSSGTFQVAGGATLQFLGGYSLNSGTNFVGNGSVQVMQKGPPPVMPAPVVVAAAVSIPNLEIGSGGLLSVQAPLSVGSTLFIQSGGALKGTNTINGNVVNSGFVLPGLSPGTLTIHGNYTQTASGVLQMEIGGIAANQFDRLIVTGAANLGGTLDVALVNGFTPPVGTNFPILQYGSRTGNFTATTGDFSTTQLGATGLTIQVQSGSTGKAVGEGRLDRERSFEFEVQGKLKYGLLAFQGELEYRDHQNGIHLKSQTITAFHIDGDGRHATFSGTAKVNGASGYTFVVDVVENACGADQFRIRIFRATALFYDSSDFVSGLLENGKIKVKM